MARSYESLMGAIGRSVFFRPERQRVRELFSRDSRPQLIVNGQEFPLFDISMNGVSFLSPKEPTEWSVGDQFELSLMLHGEELYSGAARVARTEHGPRGARIGLGLTSGFLDLPAIRRRDDEKRLERELFEGPEAIRRLVPPRLVEVVSRMVHFLGYYRRSLGEHERRYKAQGMGEAEFLELASKAYQAIRGPWWELEQEASRAAVECLVDREVLAASKDYVEAILTPLVMESAMGFRSYTKPLGYAGDYQVMLYIYGNQFEGESVYGKAIHKWYVADYPVCEGIRTRKDFIVETMEAEHQNRIAAGGDGPSFRVVGLGCGPAREVKEFVERNKTWPGNIVWTLIDQEEDALSVAYRESHAEIAKWGSAAHLHLLNLSFVQMLSEGLPLRAPNSQDFIYSAGLFDYLRESRSRTLILALYELLKPGGLMVIGNVVAPNEFFFTTEFIMDWTVFYRTREEMCRLAELLPDAAEVEVVLEPSGAYNFLLVRKR